MNWIPRQTSLQSDCFSYCEQSVKFQQTCKLLNIYYFALVVRAKNCILGNLQGIQDFNEKEISLLSFLAIFC